MYELRADRVKGERRTGSWVYFIQADDHGPVKVGVGINPRDRMDFFQTGNHHTLSLRHKFWTDPRDERRLHALIHPSLRIRGEWFDCSVLDAVIPMQAMLVSEAA